MTKIASLVVALSLYMNEFTLIHNAQVLRNKYIASNLVYLMSVCLLLRRINVLPLFLWRKFPPLCLVLEICVTLAILECALVHIWSHIQDYLLQNADSFMMHLSEKYSLDWLVCHLCCGKSNCSVLFAEMLVRLASFVVLLGVCSFVSK